MYPQETIVKFEGVLEAMNTTIASLHDAISPSKSSGVAMSVINPNQLELFGSENDLGIAPKSTVSNSQSAASFDPNQLELFGPENDLGIAPKDRIELETNSNDLVIREFPTVIDLLAEILSVNKEMLSILTESYQSDIENLERARQREMFDSVDSDADVIPSMENDNSDDYQLPGLGELFAGLLGGTWILGFVRGLLKKWTDGFISLTMEQFMGFFNWLSGGFLVYFTQMGKLWRSLLATPLFIKSMDMFKKVTTAIKNLFPILGKIATAIKAVVNPIAGIFGKLLGSLFKIGANIGKFLKPIADLLTRIPILGGLFSAIGKAFLPISVLWSVWKGVEEAWSRDASIIDKISGFLGGFFGSFVGGLLDIIKDILAFGLKSLGFTTAANWLKEFSFDQIIKDAIDGIFSFIAGPIEALGEFLPNVGQKLSDMFNWFSETLTWMFNKPKEIFQTIKDSMAPAVNGLKKFFKGIRNFLNGIWSMIPSFNSIKRAIRSIIPEWAVKYIPGLNSTESEINNNITNSTNQTNSPSANSINNSNSPTSVINRLVTGSNSSIERTTDMSGQPAVIIPLDRRANFEKIVRIPVSATEVSLASDRSSSDNSRPTPTMIRMATAAMATILPKASVDAMTAISPGTTTTNRMIAVERNSTAVANKPSRVIVTGGNSKGGDVYHSGGNVTNITNNMTKNPREMLRSVPR